MFLAAGSENQTEASFISILKFSFKTTSAESSSFFYLRITSFLDYKRAIYASFSVFISASKTSFYVFIFTSSVAWSFFIFKSSVAWSFFNSVIAWIYSFLTFVASASDCTLVASMSIPSFAIVARDAV